MSQIISLAIRNSKLFFRDKNAVFFSLLSVIILVFIYIMFLGANMKEWVSDPSLNQNFSSLFIDKNIMASILVVNSVTVSLAMYGIMVEDKEKNIIKSFYVAPFKRGKLYLSYFLSTFISTFLVTFFMFLLIEGYLFVAHNHISSLLTWSKMIPLILLNVFVSCSIMLLATTFIKTNSSFNVITTIVGTLIGFICGIYIPLIILPDTIQTIANLIPFTHTTILTRQLYGANIYDKVFESASPELVSEITPFLGINNQQIFNITISNFLIILLVLIISVISIALSIYKIARKS